MRMSLGEGARAEKEIKEFAHFPHLVLVARIAPDGHRPGAGRAADAGHRTTEAYGAASLVVCAAAAHSRSRSFAGRAQSVSLLRMFTGETAAEPHEESPPAPQQAVHGKSPGWYQTDWPRRPDHAASAWRGVVRLTCMVSGKLEPVASELPSQWREQPSMKAPRHTSSPPPAWRQPPPPPPRLPAPASPTTRRVCPPLATYALGPSLASQRRIAAVRLWP